MLAKYLFTVYLFAFVIIETNAAKVLAYYPCPSISHQVVFRSLTLELLRRGHQVTVITTDPMNLEDSISTNLTEIDVHEVSYEILKKNFAKTVTGKRDDLQNQINALVYVIPFLFEKQIQLKDVKNLLQRRKDHFDLLLLEAFFTPALALTHIFKAPTILVSSFTSFPGNYETVGAPTHPTIYNNLYRQRIYNLSLWEKITDVINQYKIYNTISKHEEIDNRMLQRVFGSDIPPINDLRNNVDMLFLNINPIWEGNRPVPPSVVYMGGLHQKPPKQLPKDLQQYLDASKNGVIYFSLGTNVNTTLLPPEKIAVFINVFSRLPYNVLWKWDDENYPTKLKNIKMFNWLPQSDLLKHPNVKLFITQGGLQSTDEAITAGVPLIGIPMLADQWSNVEKYLIHEIGVRIDFEDLTENKFRNAIFEVVQKESYKRNIEKLRSLMQDQPQAPLERAMWWIEHVIRHKGAKHLRAPTANISWTEFLELELVGLIIFGLTVTIILFVLVIMSLIRLLKTAVLRNVLVKDKLKEN